jgi:hypothetical protein
VNIHGIRRTFIQGKCHGHDRAMIMKRQYSPAFSTLMKFTANRNLTFIKKISMTFIEKIHISTAKLLVRRLPLR